MWVDYWYCSSCGSEDYITYLVYVRTTASGDICKCPDCGKEISNFDREEIK